MRRGRGLMGRAATVIALMIAAAGCGGAAASGGDAGAPPPDGATRDGSISTGSTTDGSTSDGPASTGGRGRTANKVVFVVAMENAEKGLFEDATNFPYLTGLVAQGARADAFMDLLAEGTPSEPHYVLMEAGTNVFTDHSFTDNSSPSAANSTASTDHLVTQLGAAGLTWTSYQEGMGAETGSCPISGVGYYRPRHNPFVFFQDVAGMPPSKTAPICAAHHKPVSALAADLASGSVASYNFITPNLCHDAHGHDDCPPADLPDAWLASTFPAILSYVAAHDGVLFVVWDEAYAGQVLPFLALGPHVKAGYASSVSYDHRSFLKSIEEILGVPALPSVAGSNDLADLFQHFP